MPPCPQDISENIADNNGSNAAGDASGVSSRTQLERLLNSCRDYSAQCRDIQERYHEIIYSTADKVMRTSQASQMKQLKTSLDRVANEVMHQLREARRSEVKNLASVHRDRDELVR